MKAEIRLAHQADINIILDFMLDYYRIEEIKFNRQKSKITLEDFITKDNHGSIWMICSGSEQIGYFCLAYSYTLEQYGKDCFLDEIYIKPEYRKRGIGTEIMGFIARYLREKNFKAIHLVVHDNNQSAFKYYLKNGFKAHKASFMTKKIN